MKIKTLNLSISIVVALLLICGVASAFMVNRYLEQGRLAQQLQYVSSKAASQLARGSDILTANVRAYAATGDERYRFGFLTELKVTRSRDKAIEQLRQLGITEQEARWLCLAKENSDALVMLEDQAFAAASQGDRSTAIDIVYGEQYQRAKESIMVPIEGALWHIEQRNQAEVEHLARRARMAGRINLSFSSSPCYLSPQACFTSIAGGWLGRSPPSTSRFGACWRAAATWISNKTDSSPRSPN